MKEVSCNLLPILFKELGKKKLPLELLCKGTPYNLEYLRNKKNFIEWDAFCNILQNTRFLYKDEDYTRMGVDIVKKKMIPGLSGMLGIFINPRELLRLMASDKKGLTGQNVLCITSSFTEINERTIDIRGELPQGYRFSREFFLITKGVFGASPMLIKYKPAQIVMTEIENGVIFRIILPASRTVFTKFRQLFSFHSSRSAALRELTETYELLNERYYQLEESQQTVRKQAKQLETAYSISQLIRSDLDLDATLQAVADSLVNIVGFAAVEIRVHSTMDHNPINKLNRLGTIPSTSPLKRSLEGHGQSIGEIKLWLHPGMSADDARQLLDYIIPTISMEIISALSFKIVDDYRSKLESRVDDIQAAIIEERRRISSEIHDDLGTNLSAIALMSGIMKDKSREEGVEKISRVARQSLEKISEIVWSLNPRNDKLENLVSYIRKYAMEYFELSPITCRVNIPAIIPDLTITGEQRRNIFLAVKEALHNVLKHSGASKVELSFLKSGNYDEIVIHDNGKGIGDEKINQFGNGLQNMEQRMLSAGGYFSIQNDKGTVIQLGFKLK